MTAQMFRCQQSNVSRQMECSLKKYSECDADSDLHTNDLEVSLAFVQEFETSVRTAIEADQFSFVREELDGAPDIGRVRVQIRIDPEFLLKTFNDKVGYRGHFRRSPRLGLLLNARLIECIRNEFFRLFPASGSLLKKLPDSEEKQHCGNVTITLDEFEQSLSTVWAKIWPTQLLVERSGIRKLPYRFPRDEDSARRVLGTDTSDCPRAECNDQDAWITATGGFVDNGICFQMKCPLGRAWTLHSQGNA